jgi:hypothetical protein
LLSGDISTSTKAGRPSTVLEMPIGEFTCDVSKKDPAAHLTAEIVQRGKSVFRAEAPAGTQGVRISRTASGWKQETYYGRLKGRLDLEHCSGSTVEAVEQDFQATVLLSNVETVVIAPAQAQLSEQNAQRTQPAKVNRAVSLHALKTRLIDLLCSQTPPEQVLQELTQWFEANPVSVRPHRVVPRRKPSPSRSYHYQRRLRKIVF